MIWTVETLESVLELYKEHRLLWDSKDCAHFDKVAREEAFGNIAAELQIPNVNGHDICRKLRTMRAAYQVEMRNIGTANLRGFFYKPTLKWFNVYKKIMNEIDELKDRKSGKSDDDISLEEEDSATNTYRLKWKPRRNTRRKPKMHMPIASRPRPSAKANEAQKSNHPQIVIENRREPSPPAPQPLREEVFSTSTEEEVESDDEFQLFADHIAEQLRTMPTHRAVLIQNQIQKIFARDLERY